MANLAASPRCAIKASKVSAVLQTGGLLLDHTVENLVRMVADTFPSPLPWREAMERTNLTEIAKRRVRKCSGGEQQRVAIARALVNEPHIIFADEPTANLDTVASKNVMETLKEINASGITLVMISHEADELAYAKRQIVFENGKLKGERQPAAGRLL